MGSDMMDHIMLSATHKRLSEAGGRWHVPRLLLTTVTTEAPITDAEGIDVAVRRSCGKQGWLRFRSILCWTETLTPSQLATYGSPLAGEWCDAGASWRLSQARSPSGAGELRTYFEGGAGDTYLRQDVNVLAHAIEPALHAERWISYAVYWKIDSEGRAACAFDRLLGFREVAEAEGHPK